MPKLQLVKNAFNTGEISPFAMGRTDFQGQSGNKYDHACESLQNFIPLIQGGVTKRPGTRYICPAQSVNSRLIPFKQFTGTGGFILELGNFLMRFFTDGGYVADFTTTLTSGVTLPVGTLPVASTAGFPSSGSLLINGQRVAYTGTSGGNSFTGVTGGVGIIPNGTTVAHQYQIAAPWAVGDLGLIKFTQIEDIMYLVHPGYPVQKLSFIAQADWTLSAPNFQPPPTHAFDVDYSGGFISMTPTVTAAGSTGNFGTSAPFFLAGDVGRFIVAGSGIAYIVSITNATTAVVNVIDTFTPGTYAAGTWFIRGAPSGIICVGFVDGSGDFHSTSVFGPSTQTCYAFIQYPINLAAAAGNLLNCFRPQDQGSYLVFSGCTALIGQVANAYTIEIQIIDSVIQTTIPFTNPTTGASAIIMQAQSGGTWDIETPSFTAGNGYPAAVCFFQDRLMFASTTAQPQNVWGSQTGDYENFSKGTNDDDALDEEINSGFREPIYWLAAYQGQIAAGTPESEYIISGGPGGLPGAGVGAAITPTNFSAAIQSRYGVANIQPLFIESHLIYIQRALQTVYEFSYDIYQGIFGSKNLNILHDIITSSGWKEVAYAEMPFRLVCFIDNSGNLCTLTYNREQDVWGWARHYTGQDSSVPDSWVSVASILSPSQLADEIWVVVNRLINGVQTGFIEVLNPLQPVAPAPQQGGIVAGDAATVGTFSLASGVITGLGYLYGRTVWVNAVTSGIGPSGFGAPAVFGPYTIDATGQITLPVGITAVYVQVALPSCSQIVTVRPEIQGGQTIQGLLKKWDRIWVRLYNTVNVKVNGVRVAFRQPSMPMGQGVPVPVNVNPDVTAAEGAQPISTVYNPLVLNPQPPYTFATFDERIENLGYDRDGRVAIQQDLPLPCTVLAMFGQLSVGER